MGAAMVMALSAAFAFKPAAKPVVFASRYQVISGICTMVSRPDCQGDDTHPQCDGIFKTLNAGVCQDQAYKTN